MSQNQAQSVSLQEQTGGEHIAGSAGIAASWPALLTTTGLVIGSLFVGIGGVVLALLCLIPLTLQGLATGSAYFALRALLPDLLSGNITQYLTINGALLCIFPIAVAVVIHWKEARSLLQKPDFTVFALITWILLTTFVTTTQAQSIQSLASIPTYLAKYSIQFCALTVPLILFPYLYARLAATRDIGLSSLRRGAVFGLVVLFLLSLYEFVVQHPIDGWVPTGGGLEYDKIYGYVISFGRYRVFGMARNGLYVGLLASWLLAVILLVPAKQLGLWQSGAVIALASSIAVFFGISRTGGIGIVFVVVVWLLSRYANRRRTLLVLLVSLTVLWLLFGQSLISLLLTGGTVGQGESYSFSDDSNFHYRQMLYAELRTRIPLLAISSSSFVDAIDDAKHVLGNNDLASGWLVLLYKYGLLPVLLLLALLLGLTMRVFSVLRDDPRAGFALLGLLWLMPITWLTASDRTADSFFWICIGVVHQVVSSRVTAPSLTVPNEFVSQ